MKILGTELTYKGFDVFHKGNFDPDGKANATHSHDKSQITDMPTKLSQFTNDIGAGGGVSVIISSTTPSVHNTGNIWLKPI